MMEYREFRLLVEAEAKKAGLTDYELYYEKSRGQTLSAFQGQIDGFNLSDSVGVGFRCIVDGRAGSASTERMEPDEAASLVAAAADSARYVETDEPDFLYDHAERLDTTAAPCEAGVPEQIDALLSVEKNVLADGRIRTTSGARLMSGVSEKGIFNSRGVDKTASQQYYGWYVVPVAAEGEKSVTGMSFQIRERFDELDASALTEEAVRNTVARLGAKRIPSGKYKVVLDRDVMGDFLSTFDGIFSSENAQKGVSLLKNREGEQIAAACVTLVDDPMCPGAVFHQPFDDEGVTGFRKELIADGVLKTLLYNLKTAAKAGKTTTGNAYKAGLSSRVTVAPTNLCLLPGEKTLDELFEMVGDGLYVTEINGMHAGANDISGDFALEAKAFLIEGGKKSTPVELITVGGNFYDMLKSVVAVGSDLQFGFPTGAGQIGAPSVYVGELNIAGE